MNTGTEAPASPAGLLSRWAPLLLVVLLPSLPLCIRSVTFAEEQGTSNSGSDRADRTALDSGIAKELEDQLPGKKVLVLHTLKVKRPWNVLFNRYFTEALEESGLSLVNLAIENLDLLQFKDEDYRELVIRQLEHKYADAPPDVIIVTFASTIDFVRENDLFPGIPKILVLPTPSGLEDIADSVVLPFAFEFKNNIEHALTLLPGTKTIYVVAGNGLMDRRLVSMFRSDTEDLAGRVSFTYLDDLNVEELLERLGRLPDDSFVYYLTYSLDFNGKAVITRDFSQRIGESSNRPVLSWLDLHALNIDILGGRVTTTRASATMSLDIVKRVFAGEPIDSITPEPPFVEYIYQWEELKRWGIDPEKLPPESVIQNRTYSFFTVFRWSITGGIVLMAVELLLIFFLLVNIRKRKAAEQELRGHQLELEKKVDALRASEERFKLAVAGSAAGIWDWDISSGKVFYSGRFKELLGYATDEPWSTKEDFWSKVHPDEVQALRMALERHLEHRDPFREDVRLQVGSGEYRWFYARGQALWDEAGKPQRMAGSIADITERVMTQEKLLKSERRFRALMEQSPLPIVIYTPDGKINQVNRAWLRLWNVDEEEAEEIKTKYNILEDEQIVNLGIDHLIKRAFTGEQVVIPPIMYSGNRAMVGVGLEHIKAKTVWVQTQLAPVMNEKRETMFIVLTHIDITALKTSERRFRSLMEQSPLAMELLTPDGKIVHMNTAWMRLWGVSEDEASSTVEKYNMLEDDQTRDLGVAELIKKGFAGESVVLPPIKYDAQQTADEFDIEGLNAKTVWIQCHLNPIRNEAGEIEHIVNTYVDITELKEGEEEARRQRESLARMSRVAQMEQMTGSIAHEINQPLTGILSSAQAGELAIGKGECDHDEMLAIMGEIVADAKRASEVIKGLREIYREQKAEHLPVDVNALVGDTKQLLHSEFVMQKIELTTEYAEAGPMVSGNRVQIQQVLVNLAMNAAESLRDTAQDSRHVHVGTACGAKEIRVWVEDSGPGIDEDKLETIFEPLATWKPGGTGMGLAISNSIVEAHGGRMWAENRPEGGTRVGFTLPVMKEEKPA